MISYRLVAVQRDKSVRLYTRNQIDWTDRFKSFAGHLSKLTTKDFVIDGEAVVFDEKGRSRFGDLQAALKSGDGGKIAFVAFDLLHLDGFSLSKLPLEARLKRLATLISDESDAIRLSKVWPAEKGKDLFKQACASGLEGIISKRANGRYLEGARKDWAKSKCRARQEFIICGYTEPKGSLEAFGALVLASFENGKLVPRGKVGTGFSDAVRKKMLETFQPLRTAKKPFSLKEVGVTWLEPQLVAEIEFAEITRDGSIRQGGFIAQPCVAPCSLGGARSLANRSRQSRMQGEWIVIGSTYVPPFSLGIFRRVKQRRNPCHAAHAGNLAFYLS